MLITRHAEVLNEKRNDVTLTYTNSFLTRATVLVSGGTHADCVTLRGFEVLCVVPELRSNHCNTPST